MGILRYGESTPVVSPLASNITLGGALLAMTSALAYYSRVWTTAAKILQERVRNEFDKRRWKVEKYLRNF